MSQITAYFSREKKDLISFVAPVVEESVYSRALKRKLFELKKEPSSVNVESLPRMQDEVADETFLAEQNSPLNKTFPAEGKSTASVNNFQRELRAKVLNIYF